MNVIIKCSSNAFLTQIKNTVAYVLGVRNGAVDVLGRNATVSGRIRRVDKFSLLSCDFPSGLAFDSRRTAANGRRLEKAADGTQLLRSGRGGGIEKEIIKEATRSRLWTHAWVCVCVNITLARVR